MTPQNLEAYSSALGYNDGLVYIRQILNGEDTSLIVNKLKNKAVRMVEVLSNERKTNDTLKNNQWNNLLTSKNRTSWLIQNYKEEWQKNLLTK